MSRVWDWLENERNIKVASQVLACVLMVCAIAFVAYLGLRFRPGMVPDHGHHDALVESAAFQGNFFLEDRPELVQFGAVSRQPPLYYQVVATPLSIFGPDAKVAVIVFTNVALTLAGFAFLVRAALRAGKGDWRFALLALWFVCNLGMYLILPALAQYDVLANALGLAAFAVAVGHLERPSAFRIVLLGGICAAGILTKLTFLPLALLYGALALLASGTRLAKPSFWSEALPRVGHGGRAATAKWVALALSLAAMGGAASLYGTNLVEFGAIAPSCERVLSKSQCREHWVVAREQALVERYKDRPRWSVSKYVLVKSRDFLMQWDDYVAESHYRVETKPGRLIPFLLALGIIFGAAFAAGWRPWRDRVWCASLALILLYYASMVAFNYRSYLRTGDPVLGMWFRYIFPVAGPLAFVLLSPIFRVATSTRARWAIVVLMVGAMSFTTHRMVLRRGPTDLFTNDAQSP